ncbi:MAG: serine/threonine protein kinase, partial [Planctomycetales bacterium]|nr:serine/threonine protein kinase [Planctomycetales bacterium]
MHDASTRNDMAPASKTQIPGVDPAALGAVKIIDDLCDRFEQAWKSGQSPRLADYLNELQDKLPDLSRADLLRELAPIEMHYRRSDDGEQLSHAELAELHPQLAEDLSRLPRSSAEGLISQAARSADPRAAQSASQELQIRCPSCRTSVGLASDTPYEEVSCNVCGSQFSLVDRAQVTESAASLKSIGRFELLSRLGVGGFGTVWKARDTELDRTVALKIPRKGQLREEEIDHFFREARAAAQLRHPHIVPVYEIGRVEDVVFIVSDFVRGVSLSSWMKSERPDAATAAAIGASLADALDHAHQRGVIHRDVKPSNVLMDEAGLPHLMDFGLAKRDAGEIAVTREGQILGTAAYMSPEQAAGQAHAIDRRTDVYSLG